MCACVSYRYNADGPITDARKAETTPEPLPTSRHTLGLEKRRQTEISLFFISELLSWWRKYSIKYTIKYKKGLQYDNDKYSKY